MISRRLDQRTGLLVGLTVILLLGIVGLSLHGQTEPPLPKTSDAARKELEEYLRTRSSAVSFSAGSKGTWLLQNGFHHPDNQGALMGEEFGTIRFDAGDAEPISATILLSAVPYDGSPLVRVSAKSSIDEVSLEVAGVESLTVALDGESKQELHLGCDVPLSPFALDLGPDLRAGCLRVLELTIAVEAQ